MASSLIAKQINISDHIEKIFINFKKDSKSRKTPEYIQTRLDLLDDLWNDFNGNHNILLQDPERDIDYFKDEVYQKTMETYQKILNLLTNFRKAESSSEPIERATQPSGEIDSLLSLQRTYFRALNRKINNIDLDRVTETWQIEDHLQKIKTTWSIIEDLHIKIDHILEGGDITYEDDFNINEKSYEDMKEQLNTKLQNTQHIQKATPQLDVPIFSGGYTNWPTFYDLFTETIHNNKTIARAQKLQHLKNKVRGEPQRLISHLHITADNYETAWEILINRYNNRQVLFEQQMEILLNQPQLQKQNANELKRLYDTTTECIHSIHNLHVETKSWDPFLVHILCKKLDSKTRTEYKASRSNPKEIASIKEFMMFIESKFSSIEEPNYDQIGQKSSTSNNNRNKNYNQNNSKYFSPNYNKTNQSGPLQNKPWQSTPYNHDHKNYQALVTYVTPCLLCNQQHELYKCRKLIYMTPETKLNTITNLQVCRNCLINHNGKECTSTKRCKECNSNHHTILHQALTNNLPTNTNNIVTSYQANKQRPLNTFESKPLSSHVKNTYHVSSENEESLLATALVNIESADGTFVVFRALLDPASQVSLISERVVQLLGLKRQRSLLSISGIDLCTKQSKGMVNINCQSLHDPSFLFEAEAYVVTKVVRDLPNISFPQKPWKHLENLSLADPNFNISRKVDLLFNVDVYARIIKHGLKKGPQGAPIAQYSSLGWIISGTVQTLHSHAIVREAEDLSKFWEVEDINNHESTQSEEDNYCENLYQQTTRRLENGKYEVAIPMKPGYQNQLGSSKDKAVAQFKQLEKKFSKNQAFSDSYKQFMQEYLDLGHMRQVKRTTLQQPFYLPHHGVVKLDSESTKLRVVYNGSSKSSSGNSLNDLMYSGPNLQKDLSVLILKWRSYPFVITADIEKMFRQTYVRETDQPLQTIIWRNSQSHPLQEYQLTTVTYGTKAAPFLAMRTLKQLARDEASKYPMAAEAIETSCYTDDLLTGQDSRESVIQLINELNHIFKSSDMNLRKWSSNAPDVLENLSADQLSSGTFEFKCQESRKTLGLKWNPTTDTFTFKNCFHQDNNCNETITKRQLLSGISKIFDPLGWLSPLSVRAKFIFQSTWASNITWDEKISTDTQKQWIQLRNDFQDLENIKIPRYIGQTNNKNILHAFCDASEKSYACAIYYIAQNKGDYTSTLVAAKTKLAPLSNKISLPRLELCGALLLSQLLKKVLDAFSKIKFDIYAWTDSMIVLGWLHGDCERWKPFVANRVQQITAVIPSSCWRHVKSEENPADCATRGLSKHRLSDYNMWWRGPQWLLSFDPTKINNQVYETPDVETKNKASVYSTLKDNNITFISELLQQYNSLTRVTKVLGWVFRFIICARDKQHNTERCKYLLTQEINKSHNYIIKATQDNEFKDDIHNIKQKGQVTTKSKIISLNPFLDSQGILRVGGRLCNSDLRDTAKHPIILASHSRLTQLVIQQAHITTLHGGPRLTLSYIRNRFWIISGIRTVKCQIRQCVKCRRFNNQTHYHIMGELPRPRVTPSRPFTHTGVDFTGFVELKINKGRGIKTCKGYISIFVCLSTKATHLELVSDLSAPTFLAAFRRFCARRGVPSDVYSDNGTNFVGADRLLKQEYKEITRNLNNSDFFNNISKFNIKWHFNAPSWPNAGGLWEAAVRSAKHHLRRVLGDQKLNYEEFATLLTQIEACLNSRPLCELTENPEDEYLTPGHFLIGGSLLSRPQTEPDSVTLSKRWQLVQSMNKHFWKKWSSEYLQQLQARTKWRRINKNLSIGDVVLIKEDNLPPGKWALGRVQELHPGPDGFVRVVTLKTGNNIMKRPVIKLVPLPVNDEQVSDQNQSEQRQTSPTTSSSTSNNQDIPRPTPRRQSKRLINNFFVTTLLLFALCFTPTYQQTQDQKNFNISSLDSNQGLFFDKIANLRYIKDDWKLIVYYNMSTYWHGMTNIKTYISHIKDISKGSKHYNNMLQQLEHEVTELDHFNRILINEPYLKRQKRGLINGVGYLANTLFGVLDERFADQYKEDIEKITSNENHLQNLLKNQTSVLESEYNILKRNEDFMKKQFAYINERIRNTSTVLNHVVIDTENGYTILSSAVTANIIISKLRRMQQTLIDTLTDISHGHIDPHLILPEELQTQMNIISGQLHGDLLLPVDGKNIKDIYKLLKVSARIVTNYLIIEIKIPLLSTDLFELDKIITLPQKQDTEVLRIVPALPYMAYNLNKDLAFLLSETDFQTCLHTSQSNIILCSLNMPLYQLRLKQSLCDIKLLSGGRETSTCYTTITSCEDTWIKLHQDNDWLFACCEECHVRIYCTSGMAIREIKGKGIINIEEGCTLRANLFSLYAHNNYISRTNTRSDFAVPEVSVLNKLLNTSVPEKSFEYEGHDSKLWNELSTKIENLKAQSSKEFTVHDIHHYTVLYVIVSCILITGVCMGISKLRGTWCRRSNQTSNLPPRDQMELQSCESVCAKSEIANVSSDVSKSSEVKVSIKNIPSEISKANVGTSPLPTHSRLNKINS